MPFRKCNEEGEEKDRKESGKFKVIFPQQRC